MRHKALIEIKREQSGLFLGPPFDQFHAKDQNKTTVLAV
jgi:hypothetical protein